MVTGCLLNYSMFNTDCDRHNTSTGESERNRKKKIITTGEAEYKYFFLIFFNLFLPCSVVAKPNLHLWRDRCCPHIFRFTVVCSFTGHLLWNKRLKYIRGRSTGSKKTSTASLRMGKIPQNQTVAVFKRCIFKFHLEYIYTLKVTGFTSLKFWIYSIC